MKTQECNALQHNAVSVYKQQLSMHVASEYSTESVSFISDLERVLDINFGQEEEFAPLRGECFEYTDRE